MPAPANQDSPDTGLQYAVFEKFETMDTQLARIGLPLTRLAWCENLQIVGPNNLVTVPAPGAPIATIPGASIYRISPAFLRNSLYYMAYTTDGAGYQVAARTGITVQFAPPGTFSDPDTTIYRSDRVLIADPTAGYCTWDTVAFVKSGGVSPNIVVTNNGSGYGAAPTVTITGGSGSGATATATVANGLLTKITLTNPGSGYKVGDVLTVNLAPVLGGAAATAIIWPQFPGFQLNSICVFRGLVWFSGAGIGSSVRNARIIQWSGSVANGYDNFATVNASGFTTINDADLDEGITALRSLNNFLYIFGDNSVKQIGSITVSGTNLLFTISTISSDQGTAWRDSIVSYNKLVMFANSFGVFAVFGSTLQKTSGPMDGILSNSQFSPQIPQAAVTDLNGRHTFLLLVRYNDPYTMTQRSLILALTDQTWYVLYQGALVSLCNTHQEGGYLAVASDGNNILPLFFDPTTPVNIRLSTALDAAGFPQVQKQTVRASVSQSSDGLPTVMTWSTDTENGSAPVTFQPAAAILFTNSDGDVIDFTNSAGDVITFSTVGYSYQRFLAVGTGIYIGGTITGLAKRMVINNIVIEYKVGAVMRSSNI